MTRSIFDPTGPNTERSGSMNLGPDASQGSQMPSEVTDGVVSEEEVEEYRAAGLEPPTPPSDIIDMGDDAGAVTPQAGRPTDRDNSLLTPSDNQSNPGQEARP